MSARSNGMVIVNKPPCSDGEIIRVVGIVQGVGFRPETWRLANELGITGHVRNDGRGVLIHAWASTPVLDIFIRRLVDEPPPLARIDDVARQPLRDQAAPCDFRILASIPGDIRSTVAADAATCANCLDEIHEPNNRRYRYPFTNCTHCGPRLSIVSAIPYDRAHTSMDAFSMCAACRAEYDDPASRRFHAQPNACADCGPHLALLDANGVAVAPSPEAIERANALLDEGFVLAVKGIGGFHLACDALNEQAVTRLRERKRRYDKPFALMARNIAMVSEYAHVTALEQDLLQDKAAPVVVVSAKNKILPAAIAPGQYTLGFMLPYAPLHHLLLERRDRPVVFTSGNTSDEPQCIENDDALRQLAGIVDYFLVHNRAILNRLDDSVIRVMARQPRFLRRARGYAPEPMLLPAGFERAPEVLAMGGELKNTFCLTTGNEAVVSQHIGDLKDLATLRDYRCQLRRYGDLLDHRPALIAVDQHPDYLSSKLGREFSRDNELALVLVQHHHAHVASCMAEHELPLAAKPVLGIVMDGLGFGADGGIWGGEFLLADYRASRRLAALEAVAMPGGTKAIIEPWRNTLAHLLKHKSWPKLKEQYAELDIIRYLDAKPLGNLIAMIDKGLNSPRASSGGRLFDAVAAAIGICRDAVSHEGQAAMMLETLAGQAWQAERDEGYRLQLDQSAEPYILRTAPLWRCLLDDLQQGVAPNVIAARFHRGLSRAIVEVARTLLRAHQSDTVVLSGGVFQNQLLLEEVTAGLVALEFQVLSPVRLPANDGGLALGQAVIGAARALQR